jgi:type IV secretory pathway VirB2 component (pilin)
VFTEAVDRLRLQIIRADQIITGALEAVESAGAEIRRSISGPVQKAVALIKGIQAGLEVLRATKRSPQSAAEHQEESLFI